MSLPQVAQRTLQNVANLTANFFLSLFPINQLIKLVHLASNYHNPSGHNNIFHRLANQPNHLNMTTVLNSNQTDHNKPTEQHSNAMAKIIKRHLAGPNAAAPHAKLINRLPPVTHSDLLNINQIHAASLNGLAGQFQAVSQQSPVAPPLMNKNINLDGIVPQQVPGEQQQNRKASQSNSVSQFAVPPMLQSPQPPPPSTPPAPTAGPPQMTDLNAAIGINQQQTLPISTQQPPLVRFRPTGGQPMFSNAASNAALPAASNQPAAGAPNNNQRQQQVSASTNGNKFTFLPASTSQLPNGGSYEATPVATTNSVSVLNQQQTNGQASQPISSVLSSSSTSNNNVVPGGSLITSTSTMASAAAPSHSQSGHQHHHHHHPSVMGGGQNVLASFSPPVRAHNTLAGAKYSLDGIIAVAIFGGFIFLGAIITIIVIIIRR